MAVWQENFKRLLQQKEVLILHGNVRDTAYIKKCGTLMPGLTDLIRDMGRNLQFQRGVFWGVFFDESGKGHSPMWSLERLENWQDQERFPARTTASETRELTLLTRWLEEEVRDVRQKSIFIINYLDKLTPYSPRGIYPRDTALIITLIQKIIENITENNRLIMVALQDTMLPLEYYTNSPKVAVMEIPLPDREERKIYFERQLAERHLPPDQLEFLANITDGLYVRDLENILHDLVRDLVGEGAKKEAEISYAFLRRLVNRYRLGTEEDPWASLPLSGPPKGLLDSAQVWFQQKVIGQDYAVKAVVRSIKKARAGVVGLAAGQEAKPRAVFFFAGPTGVGKTFLAKKLAEYLFDTEEAFCRFDMSEFKEEHTVSKMIGAPPGYVGYEKGGELTNAVRNRPFTVVLFDEIEKAHPKIMDIFLQILDDGRLTDSRGQTVFFTECVIVFTSNIGTRTYSSTNQPLLEKQRLDEILQKVTDPAERETRIRQHFIEAVRDFFLYEISRPELLNRIGTQIIAFNFIDRMDAKRDIIQAKLKEISINFQDKFTNLGHRLNFTPDVVDYFLSKHGQDIENFGGRGLVNAIDDTVGHLLAEQVLLAEKLNLKKVKFQILVNEQGELRCRRES